MAKQIIVNDLMQKGYTYELVEPVGRNFDPDFKPQLTPQEMLELGVFGGRYLRDCTSEFPKEWFTKAKFHELGIRGHNPILNYFGVDASQPLKEWKKKGWIFPEDPRGWFQWYCRYFMGRRIPPEDARQIKRWKNFRRHVEQLKRNCRPQDMNCRKRQRQSLLHWAYDSRLI
jgi:hypothetical protein